MLYQEQVSKYNLTSDKRWENYTLNQYSRMLVYLPLTQAIPGDSCAAFFFFNLFSELTHETWRTEILRLRNAHSVWATSLTGTRDDTITFIIGLRSFLPEGHIVREVSCVHFVSWTIGHRDNWTIKELVLLEYTTFVHLIFWKVFMCPWNFYSVHLKV